VLVLADYFDPASRAGGPVRSLANAVSLLGEEVGFSVVTRNRDLGGDRSRFGEVVSDTWVSWNGLARVRYVDPRTMRPSFIRSILEEVNPDVVYANSLFSPRFTILPLAAIRRMAPEARIVIAPRGELNDAAIQHHALRKAAYLRLFRMSGGADGVEYQATNQGEVHQIRSKLSRSATVHLVRNLSAPPDRVPASLEKAPGDLRLVFLGRVLPHKNLHLALESLQGVEGNIQVDVVGPLQDAAYVRRCRRLAEQLAPTVTVRWHGGVEHDRAVALLRSGHMLVLPTSGENHGHAVAEALGVGRPVLISDRTPWRGLAERRAGWDLPLEGGVGPFREALGEAVDWDQHEFDDRAISALAFASGARRQQTKREMLAMFGGE
jgi:glycosyltransferase involved in cell wall biosynthesis